jgi:hypothetical protein
MATLNVTRLLDRPIVDPSTHPSIGENIQGPSLIRVPDWLPEPLGTYYLYFADHEGSYIRLAAADDLTGPWRVHEPGSLHMGHSGFLVSSPEVTDAEKAAALQWIADRGIVLSYDPIPDMLTPHIASPDVHIDHQRREIVMYFHGLERFGHQSTRVAVSRDGINFSRVGDTVPNTYMRAFVHDSVTYALTMPGRFYRSVDGRTDFEAGPMLFEPNMRHSALLIRDDTLYVFWTRVRDTPESILLSTIDIAGDWHSWSAVHHGVVLQPERSWEGAFEPLVASERGRVIGTANQLRDPCIFEDDGRIYLLYAVAGEHGIALAEVHI